MTIQQQQDQQRDQRQYHSRWSNNHDRFYNDLSRTTRLYNNNNNNEYNKDNDNNDESNTASNNSNKDDDNNNNNSGISSNHLKDNKIKENENNHNNKDKDNNNNNNNKINNNKNPISSSSSSSLLQKLNPYNAGKSLRTQLESAINLASAIAATGGGGGGAIGSSTGTTSLSSSQLLSKEKRRIYSEVDNDTTTASGRNGGGGGGGRNYKLWRNEYYNYYLDDRLGLSGGGGVGGVGLSSVVGGVGGDDGPSSSFASSYASSYASSSSSSSLYKDNRPEVLIIGATGPLGQILVKRLILENRVRVRVLVRDLYSSTLEKLGTGVTYCQGDLNSMESLEYAVTDVDKIVFCAGGTSRTSSSRTVSSRTGRTGSSSGSSGSGRGSGVHPGTNGSDDAGNNNNNNKEEEWEQWQSMLEQRSQQAELVDDLGLRNLIHAYLNVRHADYGTNSLAGAAKRVLFKFRKRPDDFGLFGIDDGSLDSDSGSGEGGSSGVGSSGNSMGSGDVEVVDGKNRVMDSDKDGNGNGNENEMSMDYSKERSSYAIAATLSNCNWKQNKFGHGVFVGKVGRHGEAAIASARLRSRKDPEQGIDLRSGGFAGLVCRVCSNGGVYEAFVRTEAYERLGVEYVCEFRTSSKTPSSDENRSKDKFSTVRLEFSDFRPRMRQFQMVDQGLETNSNEDARRLRQALGKSDIPPFSGRDIRQLGFRYRGENNSFSWSGASNSGWSKFYLALDYIKLYRAQPEPEFIYLSDARIPPVVQDGMVKHEIRKLVTTSSSLDSESSYSIIDEESAKTIGNDTIDRIPEETYYKYRGEEIIRQSGLR